MSQMAAILSERVIVTEKCNATGKTRFCSESDAKYSMLHIRGLFRYLRNKVNVKFRHCGKPAQKRVYYCEYCQGFHLTSWDTISTKARREKKLKHRFIAEYLLGLIR